MSTRFAAKTVALGIVGALAIATATATPAGAAAPAADPGVTNNQIVIGTTVPLTGPASPGYKDLAPAQKAYFDYVNANGGINGRKIKYIAYDDQYNPALAKKFTSQLILSDKAFAVFGALGTPTHSAVVKDLNRRGVPDVFINTGASIFDNPRVYPTTFPLFPSYVVEAKVMAKYISDTPALNNMKRCLFVQDGEFGDNAAAGFNAAGMKFATEVSYFSGQQVAPFTAQITKLKSEGCELVVFFGVTSATAQLLGTAARSAFRPQWVVTSVAADPDVLRASLGANTNALLQGMYIPSYLVPIQDTSNKFVSQMKVIADKNGLPWNNYTYAGINQAYLMAQALKAAGKNLTRKGLIAALQTKAGAFRSAAVVPMRINSRSHQGLTGFYMAQYDNGLAVRRTPYVMLASNSSSGGAQQATFRPGAPTPRLLP